MLFTRTELTAALHGLPKNVPERCALLLGSVDLLRPEPVGRQRGADGANDLALLRAESLILVTHLAVHMWNTAARRFQTLAIKNEMIGLSKEPLLRGQHVSQRYLRLFNALLQGLSQDIIIALFLG